jgi:hypothetical protein
MDVSRVLTTLFKLAVICFIVGFILVQFDITPEAIFENFGENVLKVYEASRDAVEWSAGYIVIGAVIVVPIWLLSLLFGALKARSKKRD